MKVCKLYCLSKDACAVAAVFLIANFLTRSDVKKLYLEEMIIWCFKVCNITYTIFFFTSFVIQNYVYLF